RGLIVARPGLGTQAFSESALELLAMVHSRAPHGGSRTQRGHAMRPWAMMVSVMLGLAALAAPLLAQGEQIGAAPPKKEEVPAEDKQSVTTHTVMIAGRECPYRATAGTMVLKEEEGKPRASLFYVAYTRVDVVDPTTRPILFSFNGGPG